MVKFGYICIPVGGHLYNSLLLPQGRTCSCWWRWYLDNTAPAHEETGAVSFYMPPYEKWKWNWGMCLLLNVPCVWIPKTWNNLTNSRLARQVRLHRSVGRLCSQPAVSLTPIWTFNSWNLKKHKFKIYTAYGCLCTCVHRSYVSLLRSMSPAVFSRSTTAETLAPALTPPKLLNGTKRRLQLSPTEHAGARGEHDATREPLKKTKSPMAPTAAKSSSHVEPKVAPASKALQLRLQPPPEPKASATAAAAVAAAAPQPTPPPAKAHGPQVAVAAPAYVTVPIAKSQPPTVPPVAKAAAVEATAAPAEDTTSKAASPAAPLAPADAANCVPKVPKPSQPKPKPSQKQETHEEHTAKAPASMASASVAPEGANQHEHTPQQGDSGQQEGSSEHKENTSNKENMPNQHQALVKQQSKVEAAMTQRANALRKRSSTPSIKKELPSSPHNDNAAPVEPIAPPVTTPPALPTPPEQPIPQASQALVPAPAKAANEAKAPAPAPGSTSTAAPVSKAAPASAAARMPDLSRVQISPEVGVSTCQMHIKNIQILARDIHTLLFRSARLLGKPLSRTHTMSVKLCRVSLRGAFPPTQASDRVLTDCVYFSVV